MRAILTTWLFVVVYTLVYFKASGSKPNFVILLADDLGYGDICFNQAKNVYGGCTKPEVWSDCPRTDYLNALRKESITLTEFYVQPLCSPTRSALLTGRYPIHTGMQTHVLQPTQPGGLPLKYKTIAEELKKQGYDTYLVGKWHLGYSKWEHTPLFRGFNHFYGMYVGAADHYTRYPR
mmetsp:Transcript_17609/g.22421  ORF Transcript_17609/g.22421 Transcript_17609/m.22421 type:complete len:178 (-) Transcript_17609:63-596(-)